MINNNKPVHINRWLLPLSWLYGFIVYIRNKFFDWGILKHEEFDIPVICIGNITVGGTGKTPHTEFLIKLLQKKYRVGVLSRGYKRKSRGFVLATMDSTIKEIGDESFQIKQKFPDAIVAVDGNRRRGIKELLALENPPEILLLDDAFQHRYVKAGLTILLTDYHRLFSDDALLPAGRLRESASGKKRAHIIVVTKCPRNLKPIDYNIISKQLNLFPYQQLYFSSFHYGKLQRIFPDVESAQPQERALTSLHANEQVLLLTGIASPASLMKQIEKQTKHIDLLAFGDHHSFSKRDMQQIRERFEKLEGKRKLIITTEKDATRLIEHPALDEALKPYIYALPIEVEILQNQQDHFNQYIINYVTENPRDRLLPQRKDAHKP